MAKTRTNDLKPRATPVYNPATGATTHQIDTPGPVVLPPRFTAVYNVATGATTFTNNLSTYED